MPPNLCSSASSCTTGAASFRASSCTEHHLPSQMMRLNLLSSGFHVQSGGHRAEGTGSSPGDPVIGEVSSAHVPTGRHYQAQATGVLMAAPSQGFNLAPSPADRSGRRTGVRSAVPMESHADLAEQKVVSVSLREDPGPSISFSCSPHLMMSNPG